MINNILNNESNAMSKLLAESKDKVIVAAKKRAEEEARAQLPTPEDLQVQLQSTIASPPPDLDTPRDVVDPTGAPVQTVAPSNEEEFQKTLLKVEVVYNRFISIIDKAIKKLDDGKEELTSIREKLNKIQSKLDLLEGFTEILNPMFTTIDAVIIGIDLALAASSSTFANGSTINKLGETKTKLKEFSKKGKGVLGSISRVKEYFEGEINKVSNPLDKGISGFEEQLQKLTTLRDAMELVYTLFLQQLHSRLEGND